MGKSNSIVRNAAAHLFSSLDQHFSGNSISHETSCDIPPILDDYGPTWNGKDESRAYFLDGKQDAPQLTPESHLISRPIAAVFKSAQREISSKWAEQRKDLSLPVFFLLIIVDPF
jgi:hypothetical protein